VRSVVRKKSLGEVWTPLPLVKEILVKLPEDVWLDPTKTFIDHSCGHGNFLLGVLAYKLCRGPSTPLQALSTIYGVDIMEDNVIECRERLLRHAEKITGEHKTSEWIDAVEGNIVVGDGLRPETWLFAQWYDGKEEGENTEHGNRERF
jgi:hypothetical protein